MTDKTVVDDKSKTTDKENDKNPSDLTVDTSEDQPVNLPEDPVKESPDNNEPDGLPRHGPSTDLKTDRVFKEGQVDVSAASSDGVDAVGNRYPQSASSAWAEAKNAQGEVKRLNIELGTAIQNAITLTSKAETLQAREDEDK